MCMVWYSCNPECHCDCHMHSGWTTCWACTAAISCLDHAEINPVCQSKSVLLQNICTWEVCEVCVSAQNARLLRMLMLPSSSFWSRDKQNHGNLQGNMPEKAAMAFAKRKAADNANKSKLEHLFECLTDSCIARDPCIWERCEGFFTQCKAEHLHANTLKLEILLDWLTAALLQGNMSEKRVQTFLDVKGRSEC